MIIETTHNDYRVSKWDLRFLELAKHISMWSKDPSTKVGAIITKNKQIVSLGFNGFAAGVTDSYDRLNDRDIKYALMIHAEENSIIHAKKDLTGTTLYTWPFLPCSNCAAKVIQAGIIRVVTLKDDNLRWKKSFDLSLMQFSEINYMDIMLITDLVNDQ